MHIHTVKEHQIFMIFCKDGIQPCAVLQICEYQRHPQVYWKNSNVAQISLEQNIIRSLEYYFLDKCIGYSFMLQNIFLIDHHCKTQSETFRALAKCQKCLRFLQDD